MVATYLGLISCLSQKHWTQRLRQLKKTSKAARVARWFPGTNINELTDQEIDILYLHIPAIKAEEEIFLRSIEAEMTPDKMYELTLVLTDDVKLAEKKKAWQWLNLQK